MNLISLWIVIIVTTWFLCLSPSLSSQFVLSAYLRVVVVFMFIMIVLMHFVIVMFSASGIFAAGALLGLYCKSHTLQLWIH